MCTYSNLGASECVQCNVPKFRGPGVALPMHRCAAQAFASSSSAGGLTN
jgi:hypothetical protein